VCCVLCVVCCVLCVVCCCVLLCVVCCVLCVVVCCVLCVVYCVLCGGVQKQNLPHCLFAIIAVIPGYGSISIRPTSSKVGRVPV
jgi:hypothetical protein